MSKTINRTVAARIALVVVIGAVLAGLLYFAPKPAPATSKSFTLVLANNALVSGPALMKVNQGDTVTLMLKSDREGHLMIHGYEQALLIGADGNGSLTFVADKSGLFTLHLHNGYDHIPIANLEVQPR
jgi:plastocyanin